MNMLATDSMITRAKGTFNCEYQGGRLTRRERRPTARRREGPWGRWLRLPGLPAQGGTANGGGNSGAAAA